MTTGPDPLDGWGATRPPETTNHGGSHPVRSTGGAPDPATGGHIDRSPSAAPTSPGVTDEAAIAGRWRVVMFMRFAFLSGALIIAVLAFVVFEPPIRWVLLAVAVIDVVVGLYYTHRLAKVHQGL
ncbi:MAG: hypothetical protein ACTHW7_08030 [Actinomycetaceae bacterium]